MGGTAGFVEHRFKSLDGLMLYARDYGSENPATNGRLPLVCLAGLTRNSRDFHQLALHLSTLEDEPRRVVTIDTRGRGLSDWDPDASHYNIVTEAGDVVAGCATLGISKAAFVGTSRGGMVLHVLIASKPDLIGAVILNDVGPAIGTEGLKLIQSYLGRKPEFASLKDAAAALKIVHSTAFQTLTDEDWNDFAEATFRVIDGKLQADCDPAIAQGMAHLDLSQPLPELWDQFDAFRSVPLMTIRGENSLLLTTAILERMQKRNPDMRVLSVPKHGHAPILHVDGIPDEIADFLKGI
jgi:pimeloyl-ACP methyl ester carboxylesterase